MACFQSRLKTYYRPSDHLNYQFKWCPIRTDTYKQPHLSCGWIIQPSRKSEVTVYIHIALYSIWHIYHIYIHHIFMVFWIKTCPQSPHPRFRITLSPLYNLSLSHTHSSHTISLTTHTQAHTPITVTYFICWPEPFQFVYYFSFLVSEL